LGCYTSKGPNGNPACFSSHAGGFTPLVLPPPHSFRKQREAFNTTIRLVMHFKTLLKTLPLNL